MKISITGPRSVGKTTISKKLAEKLGKKFYSSDEIADKELKNEGGLDASMKAGSISDFIKNRSVPMVKEVFEEDNFVLELAGGSVASSKYPEETSKIREIAREDSFFIGLLPSDDREESISFLYEREKDRNHFKGERHNDLYEKTKKDYQKFPEILQENCDLIVYVQGKSSEEIVREIEQKIS
ncbi:MAG: shikimate kinase [Candidatus Pacearchaeota archaeon]